mmetsp:Transcript_100898/g.320279  ORF Transcript_100898/g.320279 Transcript_100898/m.320279 type:complete len:152 (-) Transcript_100898:18-473(-)
MSSAAALGHSGPRAREEGTPKRQNNTSTSQATPPVTTMMLCNIPTDVSHAQIVTEIWRLGFGGKYDLLHLTTGGASAQARNYGYGFVNFRTPEDAEVFRTTFSGQRFEGADNSQNGISVRPSRVQGLANSMRVLARSEERHGLRGLVLCAV